MRPLALARRFGLGLAAVALSVGRGEAASGPVLRAGVGVSRGSTTVAGEHAGRNGFGLNLQAGLARERVCFLVDIESQPFRVPNPVVAEAFRVAYVLPSIQLNAERAFVRVGVGVSRFSFSGPRAVEPSSIGPAFGVSAGYDVVQGKLPLALEGVGRWGATSDGELVSRMIGVQLVVSFGGGR